MLGKNGHVLDDFKWCHNALCKLMKDLYDLADNKPAREPTIFEVLEAESNEES
jgi:hypothetical protein